MEDISIKSSFIDWLPDVENGKTAVVALTLNEIKSFEALYWSDSENETLTIDPEFLILFDVDYEEQLPFFFDLIDDIKTILPSRTV